MGSYGSMVFLCYIKILKFYASLANLKRFDEAIKSFEKAIVLDPNHKNATAYLAKTKAAHEQELQSSQELMNGEFLLVGLFRILFWLTILKCSLDIIMTRNEFIDIL